MTGDDPQPMTFDTVVGDLKSSIAFLTRLPVRWLGIAAEVRPDFRRAAALFPVAGCLIGFVGGAVLLIGVAIGMPALAAATLAVTTTLALTGGLHEDGLADVADSFGGATAERKFQIMDDSRVGVYGAAALVLSLLLRVVCLAAIAGAGAMAAALALIIAEGISRAAMVRMWHDLPAARASGLAHDTGPPNHEAMLIALASAAVLALVAIPVVGLRPALLAAVFAALATYIFTRLIAQTIGGRTGDTLGACQQVALVAWLLGAATL